MATTRESIADGVRWVAELLKVGVRRGLILGVFVTLFAIAVVVTTRETVSDCSEVTDEQQVRLASLLEPEAGRSFVATEPARCIDGWFSSPLDGVADTMDEATDQLLAEGWVLEATYIGFYRQLWRHCFRRDVADWDDIQLTVDATRGGAVHTVSATAPEGVEGCELERRETSVIYPPSK